MITNKDIRIENGNIILNGDKYPLDGQPPEAIYSVMGQMGAKNLIPYPYASNSFSQRDIDFTCLSDGTINANGTNDGTGNSTFSFVGITLSKGTYIINGCPTQTGNNYRCGVIRSSDSTTLASDYGSGANFTLDADTQVRFFAQVMSGKTANNIIFKPMLRLASDTDDTYQPYAKTNRQLTEAIGDLSQTGITGVSVAEQLEKLKGDVDTKSTISVVQPNNESVSVTGPYTDIEFTKPVETGYIFYLIGAVAINFAGWNMSNINPVAGSIRIFTSDTSEVTSLVKTTWLKIKN